MMLLASIPKSESKEEKEKEIQPTHILDILKNDKK